MSFIVEAGPPELRTLAKRRWASSCPHILAVLALLSAKVSIFHGTAMGGGVKSYI